MFATPIIKYDRLLIHRFLKSNRVCGSIGKRKPNSMNRLQTGTNLNLHNFLLYFVEFKSNTSSFKSRKVYFFTLQKNVRHNY